MIEVKRANKGRFYLGQNRKKIIVIELDSRGCFNVVSHKESQTDGYVRVSVKNMPILLHRIIFEAKSGPIPEGLYVLHSCDNRRCVNPDHLRIGTHLENMQDMASRDRSNFGERHPNSKLTWDAVRKIRSSPKTAEELAIEFSVSHDHIYRIRRFASWTRKK